MHDDPNVRRASATSQLILLVALAVSGDSFAKNPPGTIRLETVSYAGPTYRAVRQDDDTADYAAPHWQDLSNPSDGDALDQNDRRFPVSFVRQGKVVVSATWFVAPPAAFQNTLVRGKAPANLNMSVPNTQAVLNGNNLSISDVTMTGQLPATVKFLNELTIDWEISVDAGQTWFPAGASQNRFYVTLAPAVTGARPFETVLEIATRNADGATTPSGAISRVWTDFKNPTPGVLRKARDGFNKPDGKEMTYWKNPGQACLTMEEMIKSSTGDGKCDAWARLFRQSLQNLGIDGSTRIEVTTLHKNDANQSFPNGTPGDTRGGMLIKNYTIGNAAAAPQMCQPFTHELDAGVADGQGVPAQGNANPTPFFVQHFVVEYSGSYFDPSYGSGPYSSKEEWENASIDLFAKVCALPTGQNLIVVKRNTPDLETVFTAQ